MYAWYLVFFVTVISSNQREVYVIHEPTFETQVECQEWSEENADSAMRSLINEYKGQPFSLHGVYCGDERAVRSIIGAPDVTAS